MRKKWSTDEEKLLKVNYKNKNKDELLEMFKGRTWKAIKNKANSLNIRMQNDYKEIKNEELYKVINNVKHKKCKKCRRYLPLELKYFPKDKACIDGFRGICKECKGESFNLSTSQAWSKDEELLLIKIYPYYTNKEIIQEYFPNRKIKHIQEKAFSLNLKKTNKTIKETRRQTDEIKQKISNTKKIRGVHKGKNNPMFGSHRVGNLNPNWKGGVSSEKQVIMRTEEYKEWRQKVFIRDNYTCQCCGKMTHDVEAHHLDNFADFKEKRLDIDNGITLCKKCHNPNQVGSFHNLYGTLHNTKTQFDEYLKLRKASA